MLNLTVKDYTFSESNTSPIFEQMEDLMQFYFKDKPMIYSEFSLEKVKVEFQLNIQKKQLFPQTPVLEVSDFLQETLNRGLKLFLANEKIRSEAIILPILLEMKALNFDRFGVYSGISLNADESKGLKGVCDFVLSQENYADLVEYPLFTLIEAKYNVIEGALGQCVAQMLGCRILNEKNNKSLSKIYGCVSTGELWQFMQLENQIVTIDAEKYALKTELPKILGIFQRIIDQFIC